MDLVVFMELSFSLRQLQCLIWYLECYAGKVLKRISVIWKEDSFESGIIVSHCLL